MSDLVFSRVSDGETIYNPETISGSIVTIRVTNFGDTLLQDLGFYIVPATNIGDVDFPADFPPETDYEDLLTWGTRTELGLELTGGIVLTTPTNNGTWSGYISRNNGANLLTKVPTQDLSSGGYFDFTLLFETPPGEPARRFFVDLRIE